MNILIVSDWGGALALGLRFAREGHAVRLWIKDANYRDVGDGMIEKIDDYHMSARWADFVLCDDVGLVEIADELRRAGKTVWGGTEYSDRLDERSTVIESGDTDLDTRLELLQLERLQSVVLRAFEMTHERDEVRAISAATNVGEDLVFLRGAVGFEDVPAGCVHDVLDPIGERFERVFR
jgi:hypothetical protein